MIDLKTLKPGIIYRNTTSYRLPTEIKNPAYGSVYMTASKNVTSTAAFFANPILTHRSLNYYFHNRLFNYRIYNLLIKYRLDEKAINELFDTKVKSVLPDISLALNLDIIKGRNYIHDISELNEKFFGTKDSRVGMKRVDEYFRLFKDVTGKVKSADYTNKCIFIPFEEWIDKGQLPKDPSLYKIQNVSNFVSMFYNKLSKDHLYFVNEFSGWKFYFMYGTQMIMWEPESATKTSADELMQLFFKFTPVKAKAAQETLSEKLSSEEIEARNTTIIVDKIQDKLASTDIDIALSDDSIKSIVNKTIIKGDINITSDNLADVDIDSIISPKEIELEQAQAAMVELVPKTRARLAREKKLVESMGNIEMNGLTLDEIRARANANSLKRIEYPVDLTNDSFKEMTFPSFDEAYLENLYHADIVKTVTDFQYKDRPLYLIDTEVKDVSDALNEVEQYTFKFEDEEGRRHTITTLLPKFKNSRFMKVGGNEKIMANQLIPFPIIKTKPDTVQIATNYNKVFVERFGQTISPKITTLFKGIAQLLNKDISIEVGESSKANKDFIRTIEYDEIAKKYRKITLPSMSFYFNQKLFRADLSEMKKKVEGPTSTLLPIAITSDKKIIYLDTETGLVDGSNKSMIDYLVSKISEVENGFDVPFTKIKPGKKYMYTRLKIMDRNVPLGLLLAYLEGLLSLLKTADIKYRIISKEDSPRTPQHDSGEEDVIEFDNAWLVYNVYPIRNSLIMKGFASVPTKIYNIEQFLSKDIYFELFETLFGRRNIGHAFDNFKQLLIDPITEDVLRENGLPTEFTQVFLYANTLLEDNSVNEDGDVNVHRVRCNEMVVGFLYKELATAYEKYRMSANNPNPTKASIKRDAVIIKILTSQVTKDYSDLNPIYTAELKYSTTWKGLGGMNNDRAFNLSKRAYHPSMVGVVSQASPISGAIGVARTLTLNSNVVSARGYIKTANTPDEVQSLTTPNLISAAEALIPYGVTSDDPERTAMASAQSRHTIACTGSERAPVGTGFEKVLPHMIGDTFVFKAKKDGIILNIDEKNGIMILKYDDGATDTVSLNPKMGKNAGSGFFISNKLTPVIENGAKFKAGRIVAHNNDFFTTDKISGDSVFMTGPLARVAFRYSSKVFEDSTVVSQKLAEKMSSYIVIKKDIALGKNANIDFVVKKGQEVKVNDPLMIFDTSHDDELTNKILSKIGDESSDDLVKAAKTPILSKHNGVIEDIKIYYTIPKEELSESAAKFIDHYEKENEKLVRYAMKETGLKREQLNVTLTDVQRVTSDLSGKVKGTKIGEGILVEVYIKYKDVFGVGDKLTSFVATKAIACDVFKEGEEPYLLSDPEDKIDAYIGVISVGARMVISLIKVSQINAIMIGAKKNLKKMYEELYKEKIQ